GGKRKSCLWSQTLSLRELSAFRLTSGKPQRLKVANMWGKAPLSRRELHRAHSPGTPRQRGLRLAFSASPSKVARLVNRHPASVMPLVLKAEQRRACSPPIKVVRSPTYILLGIGGRYLRADRSYLIGEFRPNDRMVRRPLDFAYGHINGGCVASFREGGRGQDVVDAPTEVSLKSVPKIVPIRVLNGIGVEFSKHVNESPCHRLLV